MILKGLFCQNFNGNKSILKEITNPTTDSRLDVDKIYTMHQRLYTRVSRVYCSSALLLRLLSPVSLLLSSLSPAPRNFSPESGSLRLGARLAARRLGGSGGLREEEEEDLESGSGETRECRSDEMPEEVDPVELDL